MAVSLFDIMGHLLDNNIETTLEKDSDGKRYLNLNTMAKSHLYLYENGEVRGRYNYIGQVHLDTESLEYIIEKLCLEFKNCLHSRTYYNSYWMKLYSIYFNDTEQIKKSLFI